MAVELRRDPPGSARTNGKLARACPLLGALALTCAIACGSTHTAGTSAAPASAVPASAPVFAEATVRPGEPLKAAAASAGRKLSHQADPYLRLLSLLQTPGSRTLRLGDVAPWLGPHAGLFESSPGGVSSTDAGQLGALAQGLLGSSSSGSFPFGAHRIQGAIVLDTSDAAKARAFLSSQAARAGAHTTSYRGVAYQDTPAAVAFALVHRFAVIGSDCGVRSVIDTTLGAPALSGSPAYSKLLSDAPSGVLGHVFANPSASAPSAAGGECAASRAPAPAAPGAPAPASLLTLLGGARPLNLSIVPAASSIALYADTISAGSSGAGGGLLGSLAEGARAMGALPGDSWLAAGLGDAGATLGADVRGLQVLSALGSSLAGAGAGAGAQSPSAISVSNLLEAFLTPLRLLGANTTAAGRDFQSWMQSAGIFASGSGLLELKGAVVIDSSNPALSRAAVSKLAAGLRAAGASATAAAIPGTEASATARLKGLPLALDIAAGRDGSGQAKFVMGLGESSIAAALNPPSSLSGAPAYAAAASSLDEGLTPILMLDVPTLLGLLEGAGLSEDPTIAPLLPFLRSLTTLAGGTKSLGEGVERVKLSLGLQ